MDNLKRRDFFKIAGIAAVVPTALLKAKPVYKKFGKTSMVLDDCDEPVYKAESFSLDEDVLEVEIEYPSVIYDAETGKTREINFGNPADIAIFNLYSPSMAELVDWVGFEKWSKYCDRANLIIENYNPSKYKTFLELLVYVSKKGNAFVYWDGKDKGILKVVYGLPEYLKKESDRLGFVC